MSLAAGLEPRWPRQLAWAGLAAVLGLMVLETQVWRPGWGIGDETMLMRRLVDDLQSGLWDWQWLQGSLHRALLTAMGAMSRPWMGGLHLHGLGLLLLEAALLAALARRWWGREAAAWAVLALLLGASAWMRWRSLQAFQAAPAAGLAVLWLLTRVRGPWAALALGALAGALAMEYEVTALAIILFAPLAWAREASARRWAPWVGVGALLAVAGVLALDWERLASYTRVRGQTYAGGGLGPALAGLWVNLGQAFSGGKPLPAVGVAAWPSVAPWTWLGLGLGAAWALRHERWLLLVGLLLLCLPLSSVPVWGLPAHRLHGAAPVLAWLTGVGFWRLRQRLGGRALAVLLPLVLLGALAEAHAWARHMAVHGRQAYGRAENMAQAAAQARRLADAQGWGYSNSLYRVLYRELGYFGPASPVKDYPGWVALAPPHLEGALQGLPRQVLRTSPNDEPLVLIEAPGPSGERWRRIEAEAAPLLPALPDRRAAAARDRRWLAQAGDPWLFVMVLQRDLRGAWEGLELLPEHEGWLRRAAGHSPAPEATLGRLLARSDPAAALRILDSVLERWPGYTPAMEDRVKALEALGRRSEAEEARLEQGRRMREGAWPIYD